MANRMILNETSYFGAGSISEIVTEAKKRAFKKALVVTDPLTLSNLTLQRTLQIFWRKQDLLMIYSLR